MNHFIPEGVKEGLERLPIVEQVIGPSVIGRPNLYYGMNVSRSPELEPLDQLDGFLVARYMQNVSGGEFFPFIAGCYDVLNATSPKEARDLKSRRCGADTRKARVLENVMGSLGLKGAVLTTRDLWDDPGYWRLFDEVLDGLDMDKLMERLPRRKAGSIMMRDFPTGLLGAYGKGNRNEKMASYPSALAYIPAEVAEAVWLRDNRGVGVKTGPMASESIYDDIIVGYGLGIIGLTQPEYFEGVTSDGERILGPRTRQAVPYIGKRGQNRVLITDTPVDIAFRDTGDNPSYDRALALYDTYREVTYRSDGAASGPWAIWELIKLFRGGDHK